LLTYLHSLAGLAGTPAQANNHPGLQERLIKKIIQKLASLPESPDVILAFNAQEHNPEPICISRRRSNVGDNCLLCKQCGSWSSFPANL
jgi:hypothetical protein